MSSVNQSIRLRATVLALLAVTASPCRAVLPDEMLRDGALEARARALSQGLRCVVCQNQSIDDSNAPLAHDLRVLLRDRLTSGDTDKQAVDFIVARYGNFVLLKPPMQLDTILLWLGPFLALLAAAFGFGRAIHRSGQDAGRTTQSLPLEEAELKQVDAILNRGSSR